MLLGFLYQIKTESASTFLPVNMKAKANLYNIQVRKIFVEEKNAVCRWTVYRKLTKNEEVFPT